MNTFVAPVDFLQLEDYREVASLYSDADLRAYLSTVRGRIAYVESLEASAQNSRELNDLYWLDEAVFEDLRFRRVAALCSADTRELAEAIRVQKAKTDALYRDENASADQRLDAALELNALQTARDVLRDREKRAR